MDVALQGAHALEVIAGEDDHSALARIGSVLSEVAGPRESVMLVGPNQERLELPQSLFRALRDAVEILERGDASVIGAVHREMTTTQAANLLGISRQYLTRLVDRGELPHAMVGSHRRLKLGDVIAYRTDRAIERRRALREMAKLDVELGAYD